MRPRLVFLVCLLLCCGAALADAGSGGADSPTDATAPNPASVYRLAVEIP